MDGVLAATTKIASLETRVRLDYHTCHDGLPCLNDVQLDGRMILRFRS